MAMKVVYKLSEQEDYFIMENQEAVYDAIEGLVERYENRYNTEIVSFILAGTVGRWNGRSNGGKHILLPQVIDSAEYDDFEILVNEAGELEFHYIHHDGRHYMKLYFMTANKLRVNHLDEDGDTWDYKDYQKVVNEVLPAKVDKHFDLGWELEVR